LRFTSSLRLGCGVNNAFLWGRRNGMHGLVQRIVDDQIIGINTPNIYESRRRSGCNVRGAAMGSQRRQNADQNGRGNRVISTLLSPCLPAGTKGSAQQPIFMRPFAPCFGSTDDASQHTCGPDQWFTASWNAKVNHLRKSKSSRIGSFLREPIPVCEAGGTGSQPICRMYCKHRS